MSLSIGRWRSTVCCALLVAAASACSSAGAGQGGSPQAGLPTPSLASTTEPASYSAAEAALPLHAYLGTGAQTTFIRARGILVENCVHKNGFSDYRAATAHISTAEGSPDTGGPYGYLDARNSASIGFHSPNRITGGAGGATHMPTTSMAPAEAAQAGKCEASVQATLDQKFKAAGSAIADGLWNQAGEATMADPRVKAANMSWSTCMKSKGFTTNDPVALVMTYQAKPSVTSEEISAATADVECTRSTGMAGVYFGVLTAYQQLLIDRNIQQLTAYKQAVDAESVYVEQVIAGGN
jgi:hypothetical protein